MDNKKRSDNKTVNKIKRLDKLGRAVFDFFKKNTVIEGSTWAKERVESVLENIHRVRGNKRKFKVIIPWLKTPLAFTLPGRYVFVSRNFFQLCANDEQFAFVVAHEIAHHDLRHVEVNLPRWFSRIINDEVHVAIWMLQRMLLSQETRYEQEFEADALALQMCIEAGYDPDKCLGLFRVMEKLLLDFRNIDAVFGENVFEAWEEKVRQRALSGVSTHPPLRVRKQVLIDILEEDSC